MMAGGIFEMAVSKMSVLDIYRYVPIGIGTIFRNDAKLHNYFYV